MECHNGRCLTISEGNSMDLYGNSVSLGYALPLSKKVGFRPRYIVSMSRTDHVKQCITVVVFPT